MFERLEADAARAAGTHADARKTALAAQLRAILPAEIGVTETEEGVMLSGHGLERRFVLDASLRWTVAGLLK